MMRAKDLIDNSQELLGQVVDCEGFFILPKKQGRLAYFSDTPTLSDAKLLLAQNDRIVLIATFFHLNKFRLNNDAAISTVIPVKCRGTLVQAAEGLALDKVVFTEIKVPFSEKLRSVYKLEDYSYTVNVSYDAVKEQDRVYHLIKRQTTILWDNAYLDYSEELNQPIDMASQEFQQVRGQLFVNRSHYNEALRGLNVDNVPLILKDHIIGLPVYPLIWDIVPEPNDVLLVDTRTVGRLVQGHDAETGEAEIFMEDLLGLSLYEERKEDWVSMDAAIKRFQLGIERRQEGKL